MKVPVPVLSTLPPGIFTDREQEIAQLHEWIEDVKRGSAVSRALIGPRRVGKSVLMRWLYDELFWGEGIVPFYFEIPRKHLWEKNLAVDYFTALARQYVAFKVKEPALVQNQVELPELEPYLLRLKDDPMVRHIERFPGRSQRESSALLFGYVVALPAALGWLTKVPIAVMLDEFQRLDQYVCTDEAATHPVPEGLSGAYSRASEEPSAPMLVSGSQVTRTAYRVLNRGLRGRFHKRRIGPLPVEHGAELALRLARERDFPLTSRSARELSEMVQGHPFYIREVCRSAYPDKDLNCPESLAATLDYEIKRGGIGAFWHEHFGDNEELMGGQRAKEFLFYLLRWEEETPEAEKRRWGGCYVKHAAEALGWPEDETRELARRLLCADIIEEGEGPALYRGPRDPIMARCLRMAYEWQLSGGDRERTARQIEEELRQQVAALERQVASLRGQLNELIGREAELIVQRLMRHHFPGHTVDGALFHHDLPVRLPNFRRVKRERVVLEGEEYELDNVGEPAEPEAVYWITEQKNRQTPVAAAEVERFQRAAAAWQAERGVKEAVLWLYSRSGFEEAARERLQAAGMLASELADLQVLADQLGFLGL